LANHQINFIIYLASTTSSKPCHLKSFKTGLACYCNESYCDTLEFDLPKVKGEVLIISTSESGLRFHETRSHFHNQNLTTIPHGPYHMSSYENNEEDEVAKVVDTFTHFIAGMPLKSIVNVDINREKKHQKIVGFGGAMTGAVSYNLKKLDSDKLRAHVYRSYYSKKYGNGYNMMRYTIGGCDFDFEAWAYQEAPEHDPYLANFTTLDDRDYQKLEQIATLKKVADNHDIKFVGSAWSPPKWMKTNGDWTGFGFLRDEYYQTWADYHVKFLELMHAANNSFWAITTGNEPENGVLLPLQVKFMSLGWLPKEQGKWLAENLGPAIRKNPLTKDIKILTDDDNRLTLFHWLEHMHEGNSDMDDFMDGIAYHWYSDRSISALVLDRVHEKYPEKIMISTEACAGWSPLEVRKPLLGYWPRGEEYILDIMNDLNHHSNGWIDWNLLLDDQGGPNYVENYVDAPIVVKSNEFYKQPTFYAMGHFSRFVPADSIRIQGKSSHNLIKSVAFHRPDGYIAVILYNL
jgi:glucosylceramidase